MTIKLTNNFLNLLTILFIGLKLYQRALVCQRRIEIGSIMIWNE